MRRLAITSWLALVFVLGTYIGAQAYDRGAVLEPRPGVIVIGDDIGGNINDHMKFYGRIRQAGIPVRVEGECNSACTLVMTLPREQACIAKTAVFGFHSWATWNGKRMTADPHATDAALRAYYPDAYRTFIDEWLRKHKTKLTVQRMAMMPAADIVKAGIFPACGD